MHDTKQTSDIAVTITSSLPSCTSSNLIELVRVIAHLYCHTQSQPDQAYKNTCEVLATHLSGVLKIELHSHDQFNVMGKDMHASNHLQERLQRQLQCLQGVTPRLQDQQQRQPVSFENLAEYIESKRTLEALVGILLPLMAGR